MLLMKISLICGKYKLHFNDTKKVCESNNYKITVSKTDQQELYSKIKI